MSRLTTIVNEDDVRILNIQEPVMATPAAFYAGMVAGGKACAALVAAAGVGAAVCKATNK